MIQDRHTIVASFATAAAASVAKKDLEAAGFHDVSLSSGAMATSGVKQKVGFWEKIKEFLGANDAGLYTEASRHGETVLTCDVEDDERLDRAIDLLERHDPSNIDERAASWGLAGPAGAALRTEETIPVTEERLRVGKTMQRRGGVRVYSRVIEQPVEEQVTLRDEKVKVERRAVDRPAEAEAFKERTIEATELHEEPVISKEARVTEEVVVSKDVSEHMETIRDTVRKIEVDVQDLEVDFRKDFDERYASSGATYEEYRPAYDYGRQLATSESGDWSLVETRAREGFERQRPGAWNTYRDAIRRGYERSLARR